MRIIDSLLNTLLSYLDISRFYTIFIFTLMLITIPLPCCLFLAISKKWLPKIYTCPAKILAEFG